MSGEPYAFTRTAIERVIATAESNQAAISNIKRLLETQRRGLVGRETYFGWCKPKTGDPYPSSGAVLPVRLRDYGFELTEGDDSPPTMRNYAVAQTVLARTLDGCYLPENTTVLMKRINGAKGEGQRWWIVETVPNRLILRGSPVGNHDPDTQITYTVSLGGTGTVPDVWNRTLVQLSPLAEYWLFKVNAAYYAQPAQWEPCGDTDPVVVS